MKRIAIAVCLLFLILPLIPLSAGAVTLEQAQPVMPVIDVYVHQNDLDLSTLTPEEITAALDGESLTVTAFEPSEESIYYAFMLDVSASIPESHLRSVCEVIQNLSTQLRPQDQLSVITFGQKVTVLLKGGESAEEVEEALSNVHARDRVTCFNEAMSYLVKTASAKQNMRRVAVIVSDGVDAGVSSTTQEELENALREGGVAVYAMAVVNEYPALQKFESFVSLTGGKLATFANYNAQKTLDSLLFSTDRIWHVALQGKNNIADGELHTLSVKFGELSTLDTEIRPTQWQEDTEAPTLVSQEIDLAAKTITLEVSEPLANMEDPACYLLRNVSGEQSSPETVEVDGTKITLHCPQLTEEPGWTLVTQGITDISMEANSLSAVINVTQVPVPEAPTASGSLDAAPSVNPDGTPAPAVPAQPEADAEFPLTLIVGAGLVALLLILLILIRKKGSLRTAASGQTASNSKKAREVSFVFEDPDQK